MTTTQGRQGDGNKITPLPRRAHGPTHVDHNLTKSGSHSQRESPVLTPLLAPIGAANRAFRGWALTLAAGITLAMGAVVARVVQLQLRPSAALLEQVVPRVTLRKELPLRGDIVDRRGRLLAATRFSHRVIIDPTLVRDLDTTAVALGKALGTSAEEIANKLIWAMAENRRRGELLLAQPPTQPASAQPAEQERDLVYAPHAGLAASTGAAAINSAASFSAALAPHPTSPDYDITTEPKKLIRYLSISELLTPEQADAVRRAVNDPQLKLRGISLERQPVRDFVGGAEVANIVGLYGLDGKHKTGVESRKDATLTGVAGKLGYVRDASRTPLWSEVGHIKRAQAGTALALSFDLEAQRMVLEELTVGVEECDAQGAQCVIIDVGSGEILAMAHVYRQVPGLVPLPIATPEEKASFSKIRAKAGSIIHSRNRYQLVKPDVTADGKPKLPGLGRNRCIEDIYEPGSTFKPFIWSTILELGRLNLDTLIDTEGGSWIGPNGRPISDVHRAQVQTWREVLINSSNIGMIKGATLLKPKEFRDAILRFGFGSKTGLPLPGESGGIVTSLEKWTVFSHTSIAYGNEISVTPVQMARAFCVFARDGELAGTLPTLRTTRPESTEPVQPLFRVMPASVALDTRETLTHVSASMQRKHAKLAPDGTPWKYDMFGKSGTARPPVPPFGYLQHQYIPSFIAAGPTQAPQIVVLVVLDDPGPKRISSRTYYGAATAGPINRRIMERVLTYLGAPPSPQPPELATGQQAIATEPRE